MPREALRSSGTSGESPKAQQDSNGGRYAKSTWWKKVHNSFRIDISHMGQQRELLQLANGRNDQPSLAMLIVALPPDTKATFAPPRGNSVVSDGDTLNDAGCLSS